MPEAQKHILIAEDKKPLAKAMELKLKSVGLETANAFDGQTALDLMEKEKFDLILLDLMMPTVDGFQVLETLQKKDSKIPVIVMSNLGQEEDVKRAKALGAADYFVKADTPISSMVDRVKKLLNLP